MSNYTGIANSAKNLIASFGGPIVLKQTTGKSIDPVTGVVTAGTTTDATTNGVQTSLNKNEIDGVRIVSTDIKFVLDNTVTPSYSDKLVVGGQELAIINIKEVKPNPSDVTIVYFVICRA